MNYEVLLSSEEGTGWTVSMRRDTRNDAAAWAQVMAEALGRETAIRLEYRERILETFEPAGGVTPHYAIYIERDGPHPSRVEFDRSFRLADAEAEASRLAESLGDFRRRGKYPVTRVIIRNVWTDETKREIEVIQRTARARRG